MGPLGDLLSLCLYIMVRSHLNSPGITLLEFGLEIKPNLLVYKDL